MKCVCGYEKSRYYDNVDNKEIGDEEFIEVKGNFTIVDKSGYFERLKEADIYVCPKCGTLKIEL